MGVDFADELTAMGHEVRLFAYRRNNVLYKNRATKAGYQRWILRHLERVCLDWKPATVLVIKGGPITPDLIRRVKARLDTRFVNFFPDNPLWMIPFECIEADAESVVFTLPPDKRRMMIEPGALARLAPD